MGGSPGDEGTQPHRHTKCPTRAAGTLVPKIVVSDAPPFTKLVEVCMKLGQSPPLIPKHMLLGVHEHH